MRQIQSRTTPSKHAAKAATAVFFVLLQGCIPARLVRDQSQIDPLLLDDGAIGLPQTILPRCDLGFWISRASAGSNNPDPNNPSKCQLNHTSLMQSKANANKPKSAESSPNPMTFPGLSSDPKTRRNQAQAELMTISDLDCKFYQSGIFGTQVGINLGTSLSAAGLSGLASLVTGRSAQNLSAASAFLSTTRATINGEVYYNYVAPALIAEINANRAEARRRIIAKRRCEIIDYPPAQAVNDVLNYHESCSFISGLSTLLEKAGVQQRSGDNNANGNAAQIQARIVQLNADIVSLTARQANPATADADKARIAQQLADAQAELAATRRVAAYVGTPARDALGYAPDSFTGQIAALREIVAMKQGLFDATPDLPADKKQAAAAALQTAKDKLAEKMIARMTANERERDLADLKAQLSAEDDPAKRAVLETKVAAAITALVNLGGTDRVLSTDVIDQGCGG
jgi:hypothetical protein